MIQPILELKMLGICWYLFPEYMGQELMTGSGCQVGFLKESLFTDLPKDTGVLIVHAANPWGAVLLPS